MSYTNVHVHISENQQHNLKHAVDTKSPVSIRLGYEDLFGSDVLALTNSQLNTMIKALQNGKGITIKMSKCQVVHNMKTEGGFLLVLAGLAADALPLFGKDCLAKPNNWGTFRCRVGFGSKSNKQDNGKWVVFEKGSNIARVETDGQRLYLKPYKGSGLGMVGDGLYLK